MREDDGWVSGHVAFTPYRFPLHQTRAIELDPTWTQRPENPAVPTSGPGKEPNLHKSRIYAGAWATFARLLLPHTRNPQRLCGCLLLGWAECTHPRPRAPTWRAARGGRVCGLGGGGLPCRWPDALSCRGHGMGISCHASRALQMAHMGPLPQPAWRNPCGHWTVGRTVDELWPGAPSPSAVHPPPPSSTIPAANFPLSSPSAAFSARLIRRSWLRRAPPLFV